MGEPRDEAIETLAGLPRFASIVAHELRNPLSAVKIALQTLERHASLADKDATRLAIALREVATIERVLSDVLDWARPPELAPRTVSAGEVLDLALPLARGALAEQQVEVSRDSSADDALLVADPPRAARAFAELLKNAAQASRSGGRIHLSVERSQGRVALVVRDEGPGLTSEEALRAFEPFFTRRARGIGLGLPRARELARRLGGEVVLDGTPTGTTARLALPASGDTAP